MARGAPSFPIPFRSFAPCVGFVAPWNGFFEGPHSIPEHTPIKDWVVLCVSDTLQRNEGLDGAEVEFFAGLQTFLHSRAKPVAKKISRICAVDASYRSNRVAAVATVAVDGRLVERSVYAGHFNFPYVAGLLYLHEGPFVNEAINRLKVHPQLVCFDAHGAAHPRSAGLATVCGMVLGIPSIGIAKSILVGKVEAGDEAIRRITYDGVVVGFAAGNGAMKYWSPGYSVSLDDLETLMHQHGPTCLKLMAESHRLAKERVRAGGYSNLS